MEIREKLVELQDESDICPEGITSCIGCKYHKEYAFGNPCDVRSAIADKMIAHGVTVQEWIPVTERLPEQDLKVLVYGGEELLYVNGILQPTPCVYTGYLYDIDPEPCFFTWDKPQNVIKNVTHWMPLPQPPKGE